MNISDSTPISETNVNQVFHLLDANRDGFISAEEFVNAIKMQGIELQEHKTIWDDQALTDVAKVKMMQVVIECRNLPKSTWLEDDELHLSIRDWKNVWSKFNFMRNLTHKVYDFYINALKEKNTNAMRKSTDELISYRDHIRNIPYTPIEPVSLNKLNSNESYNENERRKGSPVSISTDNSPNKIKKEEYVMCSID